MIEVVKCPCSLPYCSDYHLKGVGRFTQGSGFTLREAELIARVFNYFGHGGGANHEDVEDFNKKFGFLIGDRPRKLTPDKLKERVEFLYEEFSEFMSGCGFAMSVKDPDHPIFGSDGEVSFHQIDDQDIEEQADALIDIVYIAMGTAVMMGLPWQELWDDVHRANMSKVRGVTKRGHSTDCSKPEGWIGPKTVEILIKHGYDEAAKEVDDEAN